MEVEAPSMDDEMVDEYGDIFNLGSEDEEMFGDW